jgi:Asp-tRNA(Asn)/Glu-tRNA(Gln) amidotransferase B subunit
LTIEEACDKVLAENPQTVEAYKKGGPWLGFLLGQVMKIDRTYNVHTAQRVLRRKINK